MAAVNPISPDAQVTLSGTEDAEYRDKAFRWAVSLCKDGKTCPVCAAEFTIGNKTERLETIQKHLGLKHETRVLVGFPTKNIDALHSLFRQEALEADGAFTHGVEGLEVVETYDTFNQLEVDKEVLKPLKSVGDRTHWARPSKVEYWKRRGFVPVPGNSEDGTTRANEMVLMRVPHRLAEERDRRKAILIDDSVMARQEESARKMSEIGRMAESAARSRGMNSQQALNVARAVEHGISTGKLVIRDNRGTREY